MITVLRPDNYPRNYRDQAEIKITEDRQGDCRRTQRGRSPTSWRRPGPHDSQPACVTGIRPCLTGGRPRVTGGRPA